MSWALDVLVHHSPLWDFAWSPRVWDTWTPLWPAMQHVALKTPWRTLQEVGYYDFFLSCPSLQEIDMYIYIYIHMYVRILGSLCFLCDMWRKPKHPAMPSILAGTPFEMQNSTGSTWYMTQHLNLCDKFFMSFSNMVHSPGLVWRFLGKNHLLQAVRNQKVRNSAAITVTKYTWEAAKLRLFFPQKIKNIQLPSFSTGVVGVASFHLNLVR